MEDKATVTSAVAIEENMLIEKRERQDGIGKHLKNECVFHSFGTFQCLYCLFC